MSWEKKASWQRLWELWGLLGLILVRAVTLLLSPSVPTLPKLPETAAYLVDLHSRGAGICGEVGPFQVECPE